MEVVKVLSDAALAPMEDLISEVEFVVDSLKRTIDKIKEKGMLDEGTAIKMAMKAEFLFAITNIILEKVRIEDVYEDERGSEAIKAAAVIMAAKVRSDVYKDHVAKLQESALTFSETEYDTLAVLFAVFVQLLTTKSLAEFNPEASED